MSKKILWLVVSVFMVLSLVMTACGPAATTQAPQPAPAAPQPVPASPAPAAQPAPTAPPQAPVTQEKKAAAQDTPQYGGWVNWYVVTDITAFDEVVGWQAPANTLHVTNQDLLRGDWARGPAGTGEIQYQDNNRYDLKTGYLAQSYEMSEPGHWIIHIRQGVKYALNTSSDASRLVNGREFNAYDAEYALKLYVTKPTTYIYRSFPGLRNTDYIKALDKWTLEIKVPPTEAFNAADMFLDFSAVDIPKEVIDKYGDMTNWKNSVGTGPFMLTDLVPASLVTMPRNPNYFMKDPVGPGKGQQLPYVDGVKILVIPDTSTRLAAFRTGKLDMNIVDWTDVAQMAKAMPQLLSRKSNSTGQNTIAMRQDKADKPFRDIRVRRALTMAIDYDTLVTTLTGGTAPKLGFPGYDAQYPETWVSFDEAPASVKEIFTYNPEKAKQLLKDAGYPNGFKTTVLLPSTASAIDNMSILKGMWAKIGVDLTLDARQQAVFDSLRNTRTYDDMINYGGAGGIRGTRFRGEGLVNQSYVDDPVVNAASDKVNALFLSKPADAMAIYKDLLKYAYDQAWTISYPTAGPTTTFWWPWLKNFWGDTTIGYFNGPNGFQYSWIDRALKKSMGY